MWNHMASIWVFMCLVCTQHPIWILQDDWNWSRTLDLQAKSCPWAPLYENMTSATKPELRSILIAMPSEESRDTVMSTGNMHKKLAKIGRAVKFNGTDTDTDIVADIRARIVARMSACPATSPFSLPRAGHARAGHLADLIVRRLVRHAPFSLRGCPLGPDALVYTYKRVLYTISYRVPVYKITR